MYSSKLLLLSILICLNGSGQVKVMLPSAGLTTLNEPAGAADSSAISAELRGMEQKDSWEITSALLDIESKSRDFMNLQTLRPCGSKVMSQHRKQRI